MRRRQLFEIEDQPWLPSWVRDAVTEHLARVFLSPDVAPMHEAIADELAAVMARSDSRRIVDLCSGAGGPLPAILPLLRRRLDRDVSATLTDRYPHRTSSDPGPPTTLLLTPHPAPVDARAVPSELRGVRTVFNAIHHFPPDEVAAILRSATRGGESVAVFEPFERRPRVAVRLACGGLVGGWQDARAFRGPTGRAIALHAVLPVTLSWDGAASVLRAYEADELLRIADRCGAGPDIDWEAKRVLLPWGGLTVLTGTPPETSRTVTPRR